MKKYSEFGIKRLSIIILLICSFMPAGCLTQESSELSDDILPVVNGKVDQKWMLQFLLVPDSASKVIDKRIKHTHYDLRIEIQ